MCDAQGENGQVPQGDGRLPGWHIASWVSSSSGLRVAFTLTN